MHDSLNSLMIEDSASILDALTRIDKNHKRFLVVVRDGKFKGTLTDGDVRRMLIAGKTTHDLIENAYKSNSVTLYSDCDFSEVIDLFQRERIEFVPIIGRNNEVINIITKKQFQTVLLKNIVVNWEFDFQSLDESVLDYEITRKPWGFYKTTILNNVYHSKVLQLNPCAAISLQRHQFREEYWTVIQGQGEVQLGESLIPVIAGSTVFIPKACKHRLRNVSDDAMLVVVEVQLGIRFDESDIERLEDEYCRGRA